MADVLTPEQRHLNMSRIRGRNTKPEMLLRQGLHARGFRFRLHVKNLPGRPDLVLPRYHAAVLVHGCFWHGHDCPLFKLPKTRREFWETKIQNNKARDIRDAEGLASAGWRLMVIWECALRGPARYPAGAVLDQVIAWLNSGNDTLTIRGSVVTTASAAEHVPA